MYSKGYICLALATVLAILISWKGLSMRRDMPFQEIVPLDCGIAVINSGMWHNDNLRISLNSDDARPQKKSYNKAGICLFEGLSDQKVYAIEITRTDLKGMLLYKKIKANVIPKAGGAKYVVLVGASVGKSWKFDKLSERINLGAEVVFGNRTLYDFDKSTEIHALTQMPIPVSSVIIKECAAYFPREIDSSFNQIMKWVEQLRSHNIQPILATVVPVTQDHDNNHPDRFNSIIEFNDRIRRYASTERISVLDLEKAIRVSDKDRHLKNDYAQPDGLHLTENAYSEALDKIVMPVINIAIK